jgi:hypothetical protein
MPRRRIAPPVPPAPAVELEAEQADPDLAIARDENGEPIGAPCARGGIAYDRWGNPTGPAEEL